VTPLDRLESRAFVLTVRPGMTAEYRRRHAGIWPEMAAALRAEGILRYAIFLLDETRQVFGLQLRAPGAGLAEEPEAMPQPCASGQVDMGRSIQAGAFDAIRWAECCVGSAPGVPMEAQRIYPGMEVPQEGPGAAERRAGLRPRPDRGPARRHDALRGGRCSTRSRGDSG
jgi:L-rhamnose mutarotase